MKYDRSLILLAVLALMLISLLCINYKRMVSAKAQANSQARILHKCKSIEKDLKRLNESPQCALMEEMPLTELNQLIESTVKRNRVSIGHIGRISQDRSNKVDGSEYVENQVKFTVQRASLMSIIKILRSLSIDSDHINIKEITLKESKNGREELWSLITTLSYFVYAPEVKD